MRPALRRLTAALGAGSIVCALTACGAVVPPPANPSGPSVSGSSVAGSGSSASAGQASAPVARGHLEALANGIGARVPGSAEEGRAATYVADALAAQGYQVSRQEFTFPDRRRTLNSANVVAVKAGASARTLIVGAHYDSGDEGDGADDNASGVGVLLDVAARVRAVQTPLTIVFVAFGAEEADDLFGSAHYVESLSAADRANVVAMVNLDSISAGDVPYVYSDAPAAKAHVLGASRAAGRQLATREVSDLHEDADYYSFQRAGIPFLYFEATNWELGDRDGFTQVDPRFGDEGAIIHTRFDTLDYLDRTFPGRIDANLALYGTVLTDLVTRYAG